MALESFRRRGLAIAVDGVTPTSLTHALQILDGSSEKTVDSVERNIDKAHFGNTPTSKKNRRAMITGTIEITPPAAPGVSVTGVMSVAPALLACAMAQTLTSDSRLTRYSIISSSIPLYGCIWWHSGTYVDVTNGRADLSDIKMEIGERCTAKWSFEGTYTEVTEVALPTDFDYAAFGVPTVAEFDNTEMVLNSLGAAAISDLHLTGKSLSCSLGNAKGTKEYTEFKETRITDRKATFTARFAKPTFADFNPFTLRDSGEYITLTFKTKESDGRYLLLYVRGQIDEVKDTDIEDDFGFEITGRCIPSDTGNDEMYIEASDDTFALNGTLNGGTVGVAYVADGLVASGLYTLPIAWTVSVGTLPTGLAINAVTGSITGTPSGAPGTSSFTIRGEDSDPGTNLVATKAVSIVVA